MFAGDVSMLKFPFAGWSRSHLAYHRGIPGRLSCIFRRTDHRDAT